MYKKIVIERTGDLIYLKFVATDFFPKLISPSAGEKRVWYITVERFVPVPHDNWGVLIGQSGQQCKLHIITLSRSQLNLRPRSL